MAGSVGEVGSLAGTLGLGKLIAFYDDNGISIDGEVEGWFTDDTPARFRAYGWHVIGPIDGHDSDAVDRALAEARAEGEDPAGKPTLIVCRTVPIRSGEASFACAFSQNSRMKSTPKTGSPGVVPSCCNH